MERVDDVSHGCPSTGTSCMGASSPNCMFLQPNAHRAEVGCVAWHGMFWGGEGCECHGSGNKVFAIRDVMSQANEFGVFKYLDVFNVFQKTQRTLQRSLFTLNQALRRIPQLIDNRRWVACHPIEGPLVFPSPALPPNLDLESAAFLPRGRPTNPATRSVVRRPPPRGGRHSPAAVS